MDRPKGEKKKSEIKGEKVNKRKRRREEQKKKKKKERKHHDVIDRCMSVSL
jgi:hypothetical protein